MVQTIIVEASESTSCPRCSHTLYEGFAVMRADLETERAAMTRIWKKHESQLGRMQTGLLSVVGDLQGIGQEALPQLEAIASLPDAEEGSPGDPEQ